MKKILRFFVFFSFSLTYGQTTTPEIITSAGDSYVQAFALMDVTIGEPITETFSNTGNKLTQGFQQGNYFIAAINQITSDNYTINVFPNPTINEIFIEFAKETNSLLQIYKTEFN
ncbi:MAG: hypothetical protein WCQ95_10675 [Bacteroidota bacterium]